MWTHLSLQVGIVDSWFENWIKSDFNLPHLEIFQLHKLYKNIVDFSTILVLGIHDWQTMPRIISRPTIVVIGKSLQIIS